MFWAATSAFWCQGPRFPKTVPDLNQLLSSDSAAEPSSKYRVLLDAADWTTSVGYPGYANAATDEIFSKWVISDMFAETARGRMKPEEALRAAAAIVREIFDRWRETGVGRTRVP